MEVDRQLHVDESLMEIDGRWFGKNLLPRIHLELLKWLESCRWYVIRAPCIFAKIWNFWSINGIFSPSGSCSSVWFMSCMIPVRNIVPECRMGRDCRRPADILLNEPLNKDEPFVRPKRTEAVQYSVVMIKARHYTHFYAWILTEAFLIWSRVKTSASIDEMVFLSPFSCFFLQNRLIQMFLTSY